MGLMMQLSPDSLTFAAVGFAIGAMVLWFFMKGKLTLAETTARAAGEIDRTSLTEKLEAKSREIEDFKARLQKADEEAKSKQSNLDTANQEHTWALICGSSSPAPSAACMTASKAACTSNPVSS